MAILHYRGRFGLIALVAAFAGLISASASRADEPVYSTIALLVDVHTDLDALRCIIFDGP